MQRCCPCQCLTCVGWLALVCVQKVSAAAAAPKVPKLTGLAASAAGGADLAQDGSCMHAPVDGMEPARDASLAGSDEILDGAMRRALEATPRAAAVLGEACMLGVRVSGTGHAELCFAVCDWASGRRVGLIQFIKPDSL